MSHEFDQPYENDTYAVLFNGEIFNYKEINPELKSDTPLLVEDTIPFHLMDGFYAVVRYNKRTKIVTAFTDRLGKKQLYYRMKDGKIESIASEIKALINSESQMNEDYLTRVYRFGFVPGTNETIASNIFRFMPGKLYHIQNGNIITSMKHPGFDSNNVIGIFRKDANPYVVIRNLVNLSVNRRLVSDIPVATLLSGGLDSSIISYLANKIQPGITSFTIANGNDLEHAKIIADRYNFNMKEVKFENYNAEDIHLNQENAVDLGSVIPEYLLHQAVKSAGFNVVLDGTGADELFGGYSRRKTLDTFNYDVYDELMYYHLIRLDRSSMASTVESRNPFLAEYILDYVEELRQKNQNHHLLSKELLKTAFKDVIPSEIINRPKEPLKMQNIRDNKEEARKQLVEFWVKEGWERFKMKYANQEVNL